mmetsp:Transcript_17515/g.48009  ORF Transcript_17515/g.48009 Transcript_17515/m.48009 type:complete len:287 (-) Transcript_17515:919-1779(-)
MPLLDSTKSLICPTAREKAALWTSSMELRGLSRDSQPRSPASSPPFSADWHSEISRHFAVNCPGSRSRSANTTSSWSSASSGDRVTLRPRMESCAGAEEEEEVCLKRMCRTLTLSLGVAAFSLGSRRARFARGAAAASSEDAHMKFTIATASDPSVSWAFAAWINERQPARGLCWPAIRSTTGAITLSGSVGSSVAGCAINAKPSKRPPCSRSKCAVIMPCASSPGARSEAAALPICLGGAKQNGCFAGGLPRVASSSVAPSAALQMSPLTWPLLTARIEDPGIFA